MSEIKYKSEIIGKGGISVRVVAHSKSAYSGKEIVTFEYEAPKCILSEINTHRLFSRNAQSSRAVPIAKVIEGIRTNPVTPVYWGSNQAGMVAGNEIDIPVKLPSNQDSSFKEYARDGAWFYTARDVADLMQAWEDAGYHKQIVNRIGEAFTFVRGVITATEFDNFFHLRIHPAADPFIQELARCMWEALQASEAEVLYEGEWHTPYVWHWRDANNDLYYVQELAEDKLSFNRFIDGKPYVFLTDERAKQVSAAGTAQVSFRKLDLSDETVDRVYSRLVDEETPHASCVEHQATPMKPYQDCFGYNENNDPDSVYPRPVVNDPKHPYTWEKGITHMDRDEKLWSGNFKSWIQNRKLIPNESCNEYKGK